MSVKQRIRELVCAQDGSLSLTKLAAATAHLSMAAAFFKAQVWPGGAFNSELWLVYAGFATGHAAYDKTLGVVRSIQEAKQAASDARDAQQP